MGGPAFTKRRLQVKMQDISTDSDKGPKNPQAEGNNSVMRKLMCTKCPEMFFTMEGYQRHLFKDHKIRCFEKHPPQVIEKTVKRNSQETYETNYRILKSKDSDKEDDAVKSTVETYQETEMGGEDDENKTLQQDDTVPTLPGEDYKSGEHHENTEEMVVSMNRKSKKARTTRKRKGKKSHLTNSPKKNVTDSGKEEEEESESYRKLRSAIREIYDINREQPTVKCIGCETLFFSEDGMRTHFQHAHTNLTNIASPVKKGNVRSAPLMDVSTARNVEVTEDSELTNIIEPTQTRFRGRKRTRNYSKENLTNNKRSRGSPSPRNNIGEINNTKNRRTDKTTVGKNIPEVNMRRKISENSDDTSPTSKHFTRSHKADIERNEEKLTKAIVKQNKRHTSKKDLETKPVPDNKRKHQVDADDIINKHAKKSIDAQYENAQQKKNELSKKSDRKKYATRSQGHLDDDRNVISAKDDTSEVIGNDVKKSKSSQLKMEKTKRLTRKSSESGNEDILPISTSQSKGNVAPKITRGKRQKSETFDESGEISIPTSAEPSASQRQTRKRKNSGNSDDTAQGSTSSGRTTRSKSQKTTDEDKSMSKDVQNKETVPSTQDGFSCHICQQMFRNYDELKIHKVKCTKNPKKHFCEVCGKGFHARTLMQQHYDFRHTNKPKRFLCKECNKAFELKKSYDEHMMRLHNKGDYKFQCDFCGRRFFHLQEFKVHRARHTNIKEYSCGRCNNAAFATPGKLNAHLANCGKPSTYECTICHKFYSTSSNLAIHVGDVHKNDVTWRCPICPTKVYGSQGGYYHHLRYAHQIGRNGEKLEDYMAKNIPNRKKTSGNRKQKNVPKRNDDEGGNDNGEDN